MVHIGSWQSSGFSECLNQVRFLSAMWRCRLNLATGTRHCHHGRLFWKLEILETQSMRVHLLASRTHACLPAVCWAALEMHYPSHLSTFWQIYSARWLDHDSDSSLSLPQFSSLHLHDPSPHCYNCLKEYVLTPSVSDQSVSRYAVVSLLHHPSLSYCSRVTATDWALWCLQ